MRPKVDRPRQSVEDMIAQRTNGPAALRARAEEVRREVREQATRIRAALLVAGIIKPVDPSDG